MVSPYNLIKKHAPDFSIETIFDVGANKGETVLNSREMFPNARIYAFEPIPSLFHQLEDACAGKNIKLNNMAVGRQSGTVKMTAYADSTMNRIHTVAQPGMIDVKITTLDDYCKAYEIPKIDFFKIDTEGFDLEVLAGMPKMLANTAFVQCEVSANRYNTFHVDFRLVFDHMVRFNFYLFQILDQTMEWGAGGKPLLRRFDAVFINQKLVGDLSALET